LSQGKTRTQEEDQTYADRGGLNKSKQKNQLEDFFKKIGPFDFGFTF
jgi:hypothetical protein